MRKDHTQVRTPVGRDLSSLLLGDAPPPGEDVIYFMTDDEVSSGESQENVLGFKYESVIQPNHVETVIASFPGDSGRELWKHSRYFDPAGNSPDEFELCNLTQDVLEERNLAHRKNETPRSRNVRHRLDRLLADQRSRKRLQPE